jgi:hypothetical protein
MVAQSASAVVFRALDTRTGCPVAIRRFFTAGEATGLPVAERERFLDAIERVATVDHPALRAVIAGGIDPVDGIPFVVTEWKEGRTLAERIKDGRLKPVKATEILNAALEISLLLSEALQRNAVWVDTRLSSIWVGGPESGYQLSFAIRPGVGLARGHPPDDLRPMVQLAEDLLGWRGRAVEPRAAGGLGRWFNWLRSAAETTDLGTALVHLESFPENPQEVVAAPPPAPRAFHQAPPKPAVAKPKRRSATAAIDLFLKPPPKPAIATVAMPSSRSPLVLAGITGLLVASVAWWLVARGPSSREGAGLAGESPRPAAAVEPATEPRPDAAVPRPVPAGPAPPAVDPAAAAGQAEAAARTAALEKNLPPEPRRELPPAAAEGQVPVFTVEQVDELMARRNREVIVEGVLVEVVAARSGRHLYLEFSRSGHPPYLSRGILHVTSQSQLESRATYQKWIGKRVRMHGRVDVERFRQGDQQIARPKIPLRESDTSLTLVE